MIYVILARLTRDSAADLALHPERNPEKPTAAQHEAEIRDVVEGEFINGRVEEIVWTLGEFDLVITINVASAEKGGAAALALSNRLRLSTTTLTGFKTEAVQRVMNDSGHAGYGAATTTGTTTGRPTGPAGGGG